MSLLELILPKIPENWKIADRSAHVVGLQYGLGKAKIFFSGAKGFFALPRLISRAEEGSGEESALAFVFRNGWHLGLTETQWYAKICHPAQIGCVGRNLNFDNERRIHVNEDRHEVFRGHFEECLKHLGTSLASSVPRGSRGAAQAKKPVADFCGVTIDSVTRWLHGTGSFPIGESYIKLMCYLDMVGYRVIELERMPKVHRNFAELVGYGLLSSNQAAELLGYSSTSTLYQVLQGHHGANEDKEQKMWDAWKERKETLQEKKEKSQELYRLDIPLKIRQKAEVSKMSERLVSTVRPKAVVSIMEGLLALLEENSFEKFSDGELADLKQSADTVLRLSAHLSALSSRLIMSEQQKGGS